MDLKTEFHNDMINIYKNANKYGYDAKKFIEVVSSIGGYEAAKGFIAKPGGTTGFTRLYELGKLELSVENLVLQQKYIELFSEQEREQCRRRLEEYGFIVEEKKTKNPNWTKDELILAMDLYFKVNPSHVNDKHPQIVELSELLNTLPIHNDRIGMGNFRNCSGVYMKLCNFLSLDPSYQGTGLNASSKLDQEVWNEFSNDKERLSKTARAIIENYKYINLHTNSNSIHDENNTECHEGAILTRVHKIHERNTTLVKNKKKQALRKFGALKCEVCDFDFYNVYGSIGNEYIECHHTIPVSELKAGDTTKIADLALVCANCHRMLHRARPWLSIDDLRNIVKGKI